MLRFPHLCSLQDGDKSRQFFRTDGKSNLQNCPNVAKVQETNVVFQCKWINPDETKRASSPVLVEIANLLVQLRSNHDLNGEKP